MIKLTTVSGEPLSKILREVSPMMYASNRQVNRLLDGSYHVQVIGSPLKSMEGTLISSHLQAEKLNELIDQGTPLVLFFLHKQYLVYVEEPISWKRHHFAHGDKDRSLFQGRLKMIIKEEVT